MTTVQLLALHPERVITTDLGGVSGGIAPSPPPRPRWWS